MLLKEIKHQPEAVSRELQRHLDVLKRWQKAEAPLENIVAATWEELSPSPDVDYDRL